MSIAPPAGHSPANVQEHLNLYRTFLGFGFAIVVILITLAFIRWSTLLYEGIGLTFHSGPTTILMVIAYLALSIKEVKAAEVGAAFSYGKALAVLSSGLHFVPFGLMQIRKGPRPVQEFQCPGEPEKVFKGDDKEDLLPGMVRAIRVVTGGSKANVDDMLNSRMTITLSFFIQWAITNILNYASNYGSSAEIEKQVRDIGEAVLAEVATKHTPASFIDNLRKINSHLATKIAERFENSGVTIIGTRLISPDLGHNVSTALAAVPQASATAKATVVAAGAEQTRLEKVGAGTASAKLADLTAQAEGKAKMLSAQAKGQKEIMDALQVGGDAVLAAEAAGSILAETDVLLLGEGGMKDAMGLVKAAQSALKSGKGGKP